METMEKTLELLAQYQWIYDFKLTRFFVDRVWEKVPTEWIDVLLHLTLEELNNLPFGEVKDSWPESFKSFVAQCLDASLPREQTLDSLNLTATGSPERVTPLDKSAIDAEIQKGMSVKKLHEVCHMTALIDHVTKVSGNALVVDVGSGLGYLGQVLHSHYGHNVLGLEGKQCHTSGAEKRSVQTDMCPGLQNVTCELHQTKESKEEFQSLIQNWFHERPQGGSTCCCNKIQTGSYTSTNKNFDRTRKKRTLSKCQTGSTSSIENCDKTRNNTTQSIHQTGLKTINTNLEIEKRLVHEEQSICESKCESEVKCDDMREENVCSGKTSSVNSHCCDSFKSVNRVNSDLQTGSDVEDSVLSENHVFNETEHLKDVHKGCVKSRKSDNSIGANKIGKVDNNSRAQCKKIESAFVKQQHLQSSCSESKESDMQVGDENDSKANDDKVRSDSGSNVNADEMSFDRDWKKADRLRSCEGSDRNRSKADVPSCEGSVCMVGLHCCGDLTPTMLRYFVEMDYIRTLCCVSCCYHRMRYDEEKHQFDNFPMSTCVQDALAKVSSQYPAWSLNTYAMRLAAQETRGRWKNQSQEEHDYHCKNVAYRALLELCMDQYSYKLKKTARKLAHKSDLVSFQAYVDTVAKQVDLPTNDTESISKFKQQMMAVYQSHLEYIKFIEPFTALQYLLQPVLESLIMTDRQMWLQQHGYHSNIVPVFDEVLSPRNLAIVAVKY